MTLYKYLVVDLPVRDTSTHTYRTDPFDPFKPNSVGISLVKTGESVPNVRTINIWVYNYLNQSVTVQLIANENAKNYLVGRVLDGLSYSSEDSYPDYSVGSTFSVPAGVSSSTPSVVSASYDFFSQAPVRYFSLSLSCSVAPASGFIRSHADLYYQAI